MGTAQELTLLAATVTTGLIAGLFFSYANSVMPALRGADDRAFVDVMQRINRVILNPLFLGTFVGGLVISVAAAALVWSDDDRGALPWIVAGVVLYASMFAITQAVNVPLNIELERSGDRSRFEARWNAWNVVRAFASAGSFCCLATGLLVGG